MREDEVDDPKDEHWNDDDPSWGEEEYDDELDDELCARDLGVCLDASDVRIVQPKIANYS
jgi:hypothetical protein